MANAAILCVTNVTVIISREILISLPNKLLKSETESWESVKIEEKYTPNYKFGIIFLRLIS